MNFTKKISRATFFILLLISSKVFSAEVMKEQMLCFEDRLSDFGVDVDYDVNDVCVSCKMIYDTTGGSGGDMSAITVLCSAVTLGAADDFELIINPDSPGLSTSSDYVLHANPSPITGASPGDTIISKYGLFGNAALFCNVGPTSCAGNSFAITLSEGHGLSSSFDIADIIALKNLTNSSSVDGNNIISKGSAGSNVFVMPPGAAPILERVSFFDAYNISSNSSLASCDPDLGSLGSCDFGALATHVSSLNFGGLSSDKVNKSAPTPAAYYISPSTTVTNGKPNFNGTRMQISGNGDVNIQSYLTETQPGFSGFNLLKERRLCDLINQPCSTESVGIGGSSGSTTVEGNGYYKRTISVSNSSGANADQITVRATINTQTLISAGKMSSDCSDIRMYGATTKFNHWVADNTCNTASTDIYVLVPSLPNGGIDLTMYYGDIGLTNESNGVTTFPIYFEDFSRGTLGSHPQSHVTSSYVAGRDNSNYSVSGGYYKQNGGSGYTGNGQAVINLDSNLTHGNFIITTKWSYSSVGSGLFQGGGIVAQSPSGGRNGPWHYSTASTYHNYTYINGSGAWIKNSGGVTTGVNYHVDVEFSSSKVWEKCFRNCSWNRGRTGSTTLGSSDSSRTVKYGASYSGYVSQYDYVLYRRIPSNGDPSVTVGSEELDN